VEDVRTGELVARFGYEGVEVRSSDHFSRNSIDLENIVRLPLVGIDISTDQFELVDISDGSVIVRDGKRFCESERPGRQIADIAGPVAHDQVDAVGGHSPAFRGRKREFPEFFEGVRIINKADLRLISQLVHLTIYKSDPLAKIFLPVEFDLGADLSGRGIYDPKQRLAVFGHIGVGSCAFIELAIVEKQAFGKSGGVMREELHDGKIQGSGGVIDGRVDRLSG